MSAETFPCPSCQRLNAAESGGAEPARCARCGCELETLALLRDAASTRARRAAAALAAGFFTEAAGLAADSWPLQPRREAAACGLLAGVLRGDLQAAAVWMRRREAVETERPPANYEMSRS